MMGVVMRYYLCPSACKFWWEHWYFHYSIVSCSCGKSRGKYTANFSTEEKAISNANVFFLKLPPPPTLLPSSSKKQISYHHAEAANRLHVYFNYRTPTLQPENWCNSYKTLLVPQLARFLPTSSFIWTLLPTCAPLRQWVEVLVLEKTALLSLLQHHCSGGD